MNIFKQETVQHSDREEIKSHPHRTEIPLQRNQVKWKRFFSKLQHFILGSKHIVPKYHTPNLSKNGKQQESESILVSTDDWVAKSSLCKQEAGEAMNSVSISIAQA